MSESGFAPVPSTVPGDPGPEGSSEIPLWMILVAVAAAVIGAITVGAVLLLGHGDKAAAGPSYPKTWDARIAPYVRIVEKERGLKFLHPVAVRFLPPAEFEKGITQDEKSLKADQRKEIDQTTGLLRAFGLISGNVDLFKAFNTATGSGTLAYYSFNDQRITVRGSVLTPSARRTIVHELTHALQDQQFSIGARKKKLEAAAKKGSSTTEGSVFDALIEGDAERVADLYVQSLTPAQRRAVARGQAAESQQAGSGMKGVPPVVLTMIGSPYSLGEAMTQVVAQDGGNPAVDELFRDTPTHETVLLDPFRLLSGKTGAAHLDVPALQSGEKKFDSGEVGVLTWYLMLAERLPLRDALAAADGWGGDQYVGYQRDGTSCARISYVGDSATATTLMYSSLRRWVAGSPATASVSRDGSRLLFQSCDPGTAARTGPDTSAAAIALALTRTYLGVGILRAGAPVPTARCVAGRLVDVYPVADLQNPAFGAHDPSVQARVRQLAAGCR